MTRVLYNFIAKLVEGRIPQVGIFRVYDVFTRINPSDTKRCLSTDLDSVGVGYRPTEGVKIDMGVGFARNRF